MQRAYHGREELLVARDELRVERRAADALEHLAAADLVRLGHADLDVLDLLHGQLAGLAEALDDHLRVHVLLHEGLGLAHELGAQ
jgi:hypothetical protein